MAKISLRRLDDGVNMEATDENGHRILMDASVEHGGHDQGVRPMQTLLMGLGGCSAIDIVQILKKQKQEVQDLRISIEGDRETGKEPAIWEKVHVIFTLEGPIDPGKANRAVELSMMKYCSVAETLRRGGTSISWEVRVQDSRISPHPVTKA